MPSQGFCMTLTVSLVHITPQNPLGTLNMAGMIHATTVALYAGMKKLMRHTMTLLAKKGKVETHSTCGVGSPLSCCIENFWKLRLMRDQDRATRVDDPMTSKEPFRTRLLVKMRRAHLPLSLIAIQKHECGACQVTFKRRQLDICKMHLRLVSGAFQPHFTGARLKYSHARSVD